MLNLGLFPRVFLLAAMALLLEGGAGITIALQNIPTSFKTMLYLPVAI